MSDNTTTTTTPPPYKLIITLDGTTREILKAGKYALHLGQLQNVNNITDTENGPSSLCQSLSELDKDTIEQDWRAPGDAAAAVYSISYSTNLTLKVKELATSPVLPTSLAAKPGEAFELVTDGQPLVKIEPAPSWVLPGTIGFKNSRITAQPILYGSTSMPIFGASSRWTPGQGRLKVPINDPVYAWFANAGPEDTDGFETVDFSSVVKLEFRRGKNITITYKDSHADGWFDQKQVDPSP